MPIKLKQSVLAVLPMIVDKKLAKHQDWDHVVEYTDLYARPLMTGKKIGPLIKRFNKTESVEDHLQRIELTTSTTPAVLNTIMGPVRKIPRVKPNVNRADFGLERKDATAELAKAESTFYAGKSVAHWLGSVGLDQGAIDPNSFCLINFDTFDGRYEKLKAYPTLISCKDAWNFEYANGILQWLLVHRAIKYQELPKAKKTGAKEPPAVWKDGEWFCLYLENHHVVFSQVDPKTIQNDTEGVIVFADGVPLAGMDPEKSNDIKPKVGTAGVYYFRVSSTELYEVVFYAHKSGRVQAFRMGYKLDMNTDGRTCVAMWDPAMCYLLKSIKSGSELDISSALHVFLKEIGYEPRCPGFVEGTGKSRVHTPCDGGTDPGGATCRRCNGSGLFRIGSGQQAISLALPRRKEELFDLPALHHYFDLPTDILDWLEAYIDKINKLAYEAVYNTEPMDRAQVQPTATAELRDNENVYDTLQPGCSWFAESMVLIRDLLAVYTVSDVTGFVNQYQFPRNLRFESIADLVALMKALKEAGASTAIIIQVQKDIMEHIFVDDEQAMRRAFTMLEFDPFAGKDEGTALALISQDRSTKKLITLWSNLAEVFNRAEAECLAREVPVDFYDLTVKEQRKLVNKIVDDLVAEMESEAEEAAAKMTLGVVPDVPEPGANGTGATPPKEKSNVQPEPVTE